MSSPLQTPVDLSHYTEHARMRVDAGSATSASAMDRGSLPRMTIARRGLSDLPLAASGGAAAVPAITGTATDSTTGISAKGPDDKRKWDDIGDVDPEADSGSAFDVPAFLRRHEG